jgi:hypothetical protein
MPPKTDNARGAHAAKLEMRRRVLEHVHPSRVFDAFCGLGEMWSGAWSRAEEYIGCDSREWSPEEQHPRIVCDNQLAMRALDLQRFNVFDFDAYGSPWDQMVILASLRSWSPGEQGAVVLTDGSDMKLRWGGLPHSMAKLVGIGTTKSPGAHDAEALQRIALVRWLSSQSLKPLHQWAAQGHGSGKGGQRMTYTAVVFERGGSS